MDFEEKENMPQPQILSLDDDFSLIKNFIEGDESAFGELVKRHKEKVRNIIYLTLSNTDAIDDIAQEVFITVFKNLKSFRFESQFTTWLYRITINKCKDHLRKTKIRKIFLPLKDDEEYNVLGSINENTDVKQIVRNAIASLPDKLRLPIMLKDLEGFSYQEIADTMNCEIGTIKSRIFRGRETLKNILKPIEKELML
ncbi:MAG: sigma-70 family RNA polymerase sigma factor [Ignavibacteriaceae bacterium]|jgi:RNA polymerase sigma-70 factor (ECF subfamily)|nr:MAG: sigma-70 family RNA polymerase sigma factor [Ignavibacterium sp.]MBL1154220.1 sigma-70 family RNA polymerase sigma factor [Ignavibacteriota bacterium]MCO6448781.1 sigma-70 family RNA polymerase sigma factor [Ignavibacterium album]MCZ2269592.1 sigma-70 family RNA polymerase sigma factor [Ignavibacteriales bacterium]MDY0083447.1 sigma-70 family RNA polymerase sigma factor [Ignavibacteriaceae bacterium]